LGIGQVCGQCLGDKSGGKTTSAKRSAAIAQGLCRNCFRPAHRDAWEVYLDAPQADQGGSAVTTDDGEVKVFTRIEAHDFLVGKGKEIAGSSGNVALYASAGDVAKGNIFARVVRLPGGVEDVPPLKEDLEEDPDARWSGKAWCDCVSQGLYTAEPPTKSKDEKSKEFEARLARWKLDMSLNSYEEFVVAWQDNEGAFDRSWFETLGGSSKRLFLMRCTNAEEAIDVYAALCLTGEVDFSVIDSIANLVPAKELVASMEEWQQGLQARLVNKAARKITSAMNVAENNKRPLTQIWINQTREKIGVMYGDPSVKPGGKGQDFAIHAEVKFTKSKIDKIEDQYGDKKKGESVTISTEETFYFKNTKNRTASTRDSEWMYTQLMRANDRGPAGTVIEDDMLFKLSMRHLVVADKKKGMYTIGDRVFDNQRSIMEALREDREWTASIRKILLAHMLGAPASAFSAMASE
jgi:RecA/RadA recombinase